MSRVGAGARAKTRANVSSGWNFLLSGQKSAQASERTMFAAYVFCNEARFKK
jgi:hypothetical protein